MPQETPQEVRHTAAAPQHAPATAAPPKPPTRQPRATTPPTLETLPAHIRRIAEAREQYERLTLRDFAQLLYDRDIYRTKDGGVVNAGTLHRWLEKAGMAGTVRPAQGALAFCAPHRPRGRTRSPFARGRTLTVPQSRFCCSGSLSLCDSNPRTHRGRIPLKA